MATETKTTGVRTMASVVLGAVLALTAVWGCSNNDDSSCGPTTCPGGCCTPQGFCVFASSQTSMQCGKSGTICQRCSGTDTCDTATGTCGGGAGTDSAQATSNACGLTCNGCCQINAATSRPECVPFAKQSDQVCGESSNACAACAGGEHCLGGVCQEKESCAPGDSFCRCDATARECWSDEVQSCVMGTQDNACGWNGGACARCDAGKFCADGVCRTGPRCQAECARKGCCDASGKCIEYRKAESSSLGFNLTGGFTQDDTQCGPAGSQCKPCGADRYNRQTRCTSTGQCLTGGSDIEVCVISFQATCGNAAVCQKWVDQQEEVEATITVGMFEQTIDNGQISGNGSSGIMVSFPSTEGCAIVDGMEAKGRQIRVDLVIGGGLLSFGSGERLASCTVSATSTGIYGGGTIWNDDMSGYSRSSCMPNTALWQGAKLAVMARPMQ